MKRTAEERTQALVDWILGNGGKLDERAHTEIRVALNEHAADLLADVEDAIHREAEAFGDEDIASAIVTVAGVAIDSLRAT